MFLFLTYGMIMFLECDCGCLRKLRWNCFLGVGNKVSVQHVEKALELGLENIVVNAKNAI